MINRKFQANAFCFVYSFGLHPDQSCFVSCTHLALLSNHVHTIDSGRIWEHDDGFAGIPPLESVSAPNFFRYTGKTLLALPSLVVLPSWYGIWGKFEKQRADISSGRIGLPQRMTKRQAFHLAWNLQLSGTGTRGSVTSASTRVRNVGEDPVPNVRAQQGQHYQPTSKHAYKSLLYDASLEKVFCEACRVSCEMNIFLPNTSRDKDSRLTFVQNWFSNWKKLL